MNQLRLSLALTRNAYSRPLLDGSVTAQGVSFVPTVLHASELYWRQLRFGDFDVSEMSLASLFIARSRGDTTWTALPIFTMRRFFHTRILVRSDAGITTPAELRGKRVGVPEYQQTAAVWCRGVLEHEFGVHARDIDWFMERGSERSHGAATGFTPPPGIRIHPIPAASSIGEMLRQGTLDATLLYIQSDNLVDRSTDSVQSFTRSLFPDPDEEGRRYHAKTGVYPINHTVVVRTELLERHPWLALNLYSAFVAAREDIHQVRRSTATSLFETGLLDKATMKALGQDPAPYGMKASRRELELIAQYLQEQGLVDAAISLDQVFWRSTLDL
jgi:4,5-dihydroxyphthalate decarboxylase